MTVKCKNCGSTDVAWREGKQGGRYLIDTKRPHFCPKPQKAKRNGTAPTAAQELRALGLEVGSTSQADQEKLLALIKAQEEAGTPNEVSP